MLASVLLRVAPQRLPQLLEFYGGLGMRSMPGHSPVELRIPGESQSCSLKFLPDEQVKVGYSHKGNDLYWKIGLAIDDVDAASKCLGCSPGSQFLDIGFLTHLADPAGFCIELLQTTFEASSAQRARRLADRAASAAATSRLGQFVIGQITTRITEPTQSLDFYQKVLGMKLLSIQPVKRYNFTLYFLAYTEETPPNADLEAVENREWLWQRPYTTLELQHRWGSEPGSLRPAPPEEEGLVSIQVLWPKEQLSRLPLNPKGRLRDPDGLEIEVLAV